MTLGKPHAIRKALALLNLGLTAALGLAVWAWLDVEPPAEASTADADRIAWISARRTGLRWRPQSPVSDERFDRTFLRFAKQTPRHWPFSGPMPPAPRDDEDTPPPAAPAEKDLAELGFVHIVITGEEDPVVGFTFRGPPVRRVAIGPGEYFHPVPTTPARFRLLAVERLGDERARVHYEVMERDRVLREAHLLWERGGHTDAEAAEVLRAGGIVLADDTQAAPPRAKAARSAEALRTERLEAMRPRRHVNPRNRRDRVIEFDEATYRALRGKGIGALLKHVKTAPATDEATGQALGLRIVGHDAQLPADRFDVRKGDTLVSIAGQKVTSRADVIRIAGTLDPDVLVPVVIDRQGVLHTYRIDARDPVTKRSFRYFDDLD